VRVEPGAGGDDVVVVDQQQPMVGVVGVAVTAEGERVLGVEPADVALEPTIGPANVDSGGEFRTPHR